MLELLCEYWLEVSLELDNGDGKCSVPQPIDRSSANVSLPNNFVPLIVACSLQRFVLWLFSWWRRRCYHLDCRGVAGHYSQRFVWFAMLSVIWVSALLSLPWFAYVGRGVYPPLPTPRHLTLVFRCSSLFTFKGTVIQFLPKGINCTVLRCAIQFLPKGINWKHPHSSAFVVRFVQLRQQGMYWQQYIGLSFASATTMSPLLHFVEIAVSFDGFQV